MRRSDAQMRLTFPLRCAPVLKTKIWGGRGLSEVLGKRLPPGDPVGEAWEVADVPEGTSSIAGGPLAGMSLREVVERFGPQLVPGDDEFPLLVKFIDAQDDISIQVHPTEQVCRQLYRGERSKNETWVILHVEPGGAVLHGLREGVTLDEVRRRISEGSVVEAMRRIDVAPGDVIHLPAGTLHAMLRGVLLLEVQDPSDSTFRVYDHDRLGVDGRPRELHIEQALRSLRLNGPGPAVIEPGAEEQPWGERQLLVDIPSYRMERWLVRREMTWRPPGGVPVVLVVIAGEVCLREDGDDERFTTGETVIVPPQIQRLRIIPDGGARIVAAFAPRRGGRRPAVNEGTD